MKKEVRTQIIFIVCFLAAWQFVYQTQAFSDLVFPSLGEIGKSFVEGFQDDSLLSYTLYSMELIAKGLMRYQLAHVSASSQAPAKMFSSLLE